MNDLIKRKTRGAIFRSSTQWYKKGERISRYYLNLEKKRNYNLRAIDRLELEHSTSTKDPTVILHEMKNFYKSLCKSNDVQNAEAYLNNFKTYKVSEKHYNAINENITETELLKMSIPCKITNPQVKMAYQLNFANSSGMTLKQSC